jgi:predicted Zn-dependent protease
MRNWKRMRLYIATCLGIIVTVQISLICVTGLAEQRKLKPGFNLFSKEQDVQLGKEAAAQVEKQMQIVNNKDLENFINQIGRKLIATPEADAKSFAYSFKVVNDKSINAFALPGGPAFIHTGLIAAADNEGQVAGVMAHEISHVALRHGTNQASKANLIELPALLAGSVAGGSMIGQLAQIGVGLGANSVLLKFSRNAERDADLLGTRIMSGAGYNPIEMARFFEKLESETGAARSSFEQFLSDHPNPGNRVTAVEEEIQYLPKRSYASDSGQIERMKQIIAKLPPPPPPPKPTKQVTGGTEK